MPRWIVTVVLVLAFSIPATPISAAGGTASMRFSAPSPNPGLVDEDVNFSLVIDVSFVDPGVAGVELYLSYNPTLVGPSTSPLGVVVPLPDFFGPSNITWYEVLPANQCPGAANPCVHLVAAGPPQMTHSGAAARFYFRGKAEGNACFSVLSSAMKDADGYPVDHSAIPDVCVPIVRRTSVTGTVTRQGVPANPNPGAGTRACSEVWATSGATRFGPVFTDGLGNFRLRELLNGSYILHAEYPGYLGSEKSITISPGDPTTVDAWVTTLRGGDVNGDNRINILDVGKIVSLFGSTGVPVRSDAPPDCNDPDEATDINDDGSINISDLAIAAGNWGLVEPTNWP
jgi:hypothetical protein